MDFLVICTVAFLASCLTFFSGFGLGTLLLPAFAAFFPVEQAVAMTAVVHMLNGIFKASLVGRHARWDIVLRFGIPAIAAALLGAWLLHWLIDLAPVYRYRWFDHGFEMTPVKVVVGMLLIAFSLIEVVPRLRDLQFAPRYLPIGGLLSGFFGGLAGLQGALRSAFLSRAGLDKEAFIATGVIIAVLIDVSRLGVYSQSAAEVGYSLDYALLLAAIAAAFLGAYLGNRFLKKMTMPGIQRIVATMLFLFAIGLILGVM